MKLCLPSSNKLPQKEAGTETELTNGDCAWNDQPKGRRRKVNYN